MRVISLLSRPSHHSNTSLRGALPSAVNLPLCYHMCRLALGDFVTLCYLNNAPYSWIPTTMSLQPRDFHLCPTVMMTSCLLFCSWGRGNVKAPKSSANLINITSSKILIIFTSPSTPNVTVLRKSVKLYTKVLNHFLFLHPTHDALHQHPLPPHHLLHPPILHINSLHPPLSNHDISIPSPQDLSITLSPPQRKPRPRRPLRSHHRRYKCRRSQRPQSVFGNLTPHLLRGPELQLSLNAGTNTAGKRWMAAIGPAALKSTISMSVS